MVSLTTIASSGSTSFSSCAAQRGVDRGAGRGSRLRSPARSRWCRSPIARAAPFATGRTICRSDREAPSDGPTSPAATTSARKPQNGSRGCSGSSPSTSTFLSVMRARRMPGQHRLDQQDHVGVRERLRHLVDHDAAVEAVRAREIEVVGLPGLVHRRVERLGERDQRLTAAGSLPASSVTITGFFAAQRLRDFSRGRRNHRWARQRGRRRVGCHAGDAGTRWAPTRTPGRAAPTPRAGRRAARYAAAARHVEAEAPLHAGLHQARRAAEVGEQAQPLPAHLGRRRLGEADHLAGQDHHRDALVQRGARDHRRVQRADGGVHHHRRELPGRLGVAERHGHRGFFMPRRDIPFRPEGIRPRAPPTAAPSRSRAKRRCAPPPCRAAPSAGPRRRSSRAMDARGVAAADLASSAATRRSARRTGRVLLADRIVAAHHQAVGADALEQHLEHLRVVDAGVVVERAQELARASCRRCCAPCPAGWR